MTFRDPQLEIFTSSTTAIFILTSDWEKNNRREKFIPEWLLFHSRNKSECLQNRSEEKNNFHERTTWEDISRRHKHLELDCSAVFCTETRDKKEESEIHVHHSYIFVPLCWLKVPPCSFLQGSCLFLQKIYPALEWKTKSTHPGFAPAACEF